MRKQVYISADYDRLNGDQDVVNELNKWGNDSLHKVDFIDMSTNHESLSQPIMKIGY